MSQAEIEAILASTGNGTPADQPRFSAVPVEHSEIAASPSVQCEEGIDEQIALSSEAVTQIASGLIRLCRELSEGMGLDGDEVFIDEARLAESLKRTRITVNSFLTFHSPATISIWRFAGILVYWLAKLRPISVLSESGSQIHPLNELVAHAFALKYLGRVNVPSMERSINSQLIWILQYRTTDPLALGMLYRIIFNQYGSRSTCQN